MTSRRLISSIVATLALLWLPGPTSVKATELTSPGKRVSATVSTDLQGRLTFSVTRICAVTRGEVVVIEPSAVGITVAGQDLGDGVEIGRLEKREILEKFARRGVKSQGINHSIAYQLPITHKASGMRWTMDLRVFDDGVAYRYRVPGSGQRRIDGEATSWHIPQGSIVWLQSNTVNYEGEYGRYRAEEIPTEAGGRQLFVGCPLTAELPGGGYALITEACLYSYSGMTLRPATAGKFEAAFEDDPKGWPSDGTIVSPWRVTVVAQDLNALVNSDLILSLGSAPDPELFAQGPNSSWIRPGKGLITWAVFGNDGAQWHRQKWFVDMCAALNCEYLLVDGGWRSERWGFLKDGGDLWGRLTELCEYAAGKNVGIFVWHAYPEGREDGPGLTDREGRNDFFRRCKEAGVKGVKIDFFDSERKEIVDVYEDILRVTAKHQLMVNFHGANKPTGEIRTWPHEITREGIREQEYLLWDQLPLAHYGALPFTRIVAGHGDFLPAYVRPKYLKNSTAIFQLGTAVIYTSPFICWPDHPEAYLQSPLLHLIRTMPSVWNETRVLEGSAIGKLVAYARRSNRDWYVAILNCDDQETSYELSLSFLGDGDYAATLYHDREQARAAMRIESGSVMNKKQQISVRLQSGGGFVATLHKPKEYKEP
jgi:alpha-glucosidase